MNHSEFERELTRTPSHASLTSHELMGMGKLASRLYLGKDIPLNDAVVKVASGCPGISQEQVKRVTEFANVSTYQNLFQKQANKHIHFEIADPNAVLRTLNSQAEPPLMKVASAHYSAPPPTRRVDELQADFELCEMFGVDLEKTAAMRKGEVSPEAALGHVKTASKGSMLVEKDLESFLSVDAVKTAAQADKNPYPEANPFGDLLRTKSDLHKTAEDLEYAVDKNEALYKEAHAKFAQSVRQHVLSGGNMGEVTHMMASVATPDVVKTAAESVMPFVLSGLPQHQLVDMEAQLIQYEMSKTASDRTPNPDHPVVQSFAGMMKLAEGDVVLRERYSQVQDLLQQVEAVTREVSAAQGV